MIPSASRDDLVKKYDVPVPRYTSYPTLPHWDNEGFSYEKWIHQVIKCFDESNSPKGISLYVHLPFCESLCTYCACNKRITKNHTVEERYSNALLEEWKLYKEIIGDTPVIRELHIGGGTPTFFSPANLQRLVTGILEGALIHELNEFSFEGHPNNTTATHLKVLFDCGFKRVSFGVQDIDPQVQKAIHRIQPFENLAKVTALGRAIGYESISFDLIYGLPFQTISTIQNTVRHIISLKPDRLAFYSYAHVPWKHPGQRGYEETDIPTDVTKRALYETGRNLFHDAGYADIGMDHFALPHDSLAIAFRRGKLRRNFMGYTTTSSDLLIGLGASAISDAKYGYAQNKKEVEGYEEEVFSGKLPLLKGHIQSENDLLLKRCILSIASSGFLSSDYLSRITNSSISNELVVMQEEGIIELKEEGLLVTDLGRAFIRNICSVFDLRLRTLQQKDKELFSKAI